MAEQELTRTSLLEELKPHVADAIQEETRLFDKPMWVVDGERIPEVCEAAKAAGYIHLDCITAIDKIEDDTIEVVYNLYAYETLEHLALKVRMDRDDARVPSVTGVWNAARFLEREQYDLVGVVFEGHPNLRRILLPDPWQGHPLRKDYDMTTEQYISKGPQGGDVVSTDPESGW